MYRIRFRTPGWAVALVVGGLSQLGACTARPAGSAPRAVVNRFTADTTLQGISTAQDARATGKLLAYLQRPEARYRRAAALALASVQDPAATPGLLVSLADAQDSVRTAAAFALGQAGDTTAEADLRRQLLADPNPTVRRYVLEALGRSGTRQALATLAQLPPALARDTAALTGQAWGLYRAGARGLTSEAAVRRLVQLLATTNPDGARLAAANALARTKGLNLAPYAPEIINAAQNDPVAAVRSAAATALSKAAPDARATSSLTALARRDTDYRVRISAVRSLAGFGYAAGKESVWAALTDDHDQVALTAAEFFLTNATNEPGAVFLEKANQLAAWRVRATLLAAALKHGGPQRGAIRQAIQARYAGSTNPYEKGYLLKALGEDPAAYEFVGRSIWPTPPARVVATYGIEALVAIRRLPGFPAEQRADFALVLQRAVGSGDVAVMGTAAEAIRDPALALKPLFVNSKFLRDARDQLQLPRDLEAWESLQKTIDYLDNLPPTKVPVAPAATHPIDWQLVATIPARQRALVTTSKGPVQLELLVNEAPGSVASFVALVRQGFYAGKRFHRVVPNFVAQGGCPRGDGWGSTDYNLRSEFADRRYTEGAVGLASAGKDTESCQWFITHTATPHLDGRYTIFARVTNGMEVVSRLEIGDRIERVELVK